MHGFERDVVKRLFDHDLAHRAKLEETLQVIRSERVRRVVEISSEMKNYFRQRKKGHWREASLRLYQSSARRSTIRDAARRSFLARESKECTFAPKALNKKSAKIAKRIQTSFEERNNMTLLQKKRGNGEQKHIHRSIGTGRISNINTYNEAPGMKSQNSPFRSPSLNIEDWSLPE